ncbi:hypothetical protein GCM10009840_11480 [Pseudolysinimonas kribbensis]|uniref:Uncharacterized protein n=1 Tax=Pseudolysinimonas kribbensis TaxID=433641 RepID=A0ABQ6K9T6_9MICO|nr:hypothetical protein [Pseudolysinimonas kribbensis]GMA95582.1 hypothetical protein GCM10025881_24060 [Pseudolysinimonas kribbensis]
MTIAKTHAPTLLSRISTPYLRALGELQVCELRLRHVARAGGMGPAWQEATDFLLQQSEALQERLAEGPLVEHALHVQAPDGSLVPADIVFVQRLVRRMSYQLGLATADASLATGSMPTAPVSTIRQTADALAS